MRPSPRPNDPQLATDDPMPQDSVVFLVEEFQSSLPAMGIGAAPPLVQTLYLREAGDTAEISVNDLHQGQIGDCFLISAIGELALTHPDAIKNMIRANADGTETVTLYTDQYGRVPVYNSSAFKPVAVTVNNIFPSYSVNNGATQDVAAGKKEIWAQVLEKAVATLDGGYNLIASGGNPVIAMEELTGHAAKWMAPASVTLAALQGFIAAGDMITFDTPSRSNLPYNLVGNHAYMFEKLTTVNGTPMVQLGNPWGFNQPALIPFAQVAKTFVEIDVGRFT